MSGSGEAAPDEDPGVANPEHNEDADVPNTSDAETEPAMLEEEEMPTYMSLTCSSRPDESTVETEPQRCVEDTSRQGDGNANRAASPYNSDDQGGGSIYVVSSGEESNRPFDDEDYESDEMELEDEEEEEDDDEDSRPGYNDDEEDSEGDIEPEQFERSSDDFVLRYDTGLVIQKARSRSLQDLTNSRGNLSRFVGKRRSVDMMGNYNTGLTRPARECPQDPLGDAKKPAKSSRYSDVQSKVKLYIQSIKDQNRRSMELKNSGNAVVKNFNEIKGANAEVSCTRINPLNKMVKGNALNVAKITLEPNHETLPDVTYGGRRLGDNVTDKEPIVVPESKQLTDKDASRETTLIPDDQTITVNNVVISSKTNGIIDCTTENHIDDVVEPMETCATNGQDEMTAIFDLRTLSYEEYVNSDQASSTKIGNNEALLPIVEENNVDTGLDEKKEILITTNVEPIRNSAPMKIDSVKISYSAPEISQTVSDNSINPKSTSNEIVKPNHENSDVTMLWTMLDQKTAQFNEKKAQYDGIRDAFQKTLTENISLKRELEELKKTLAQCRAEKKPAATKVASVQTDDIAETVKTQISNDDSKISNVEMKPPMSAKLLTSSISSALSSIEQWSDSNCSPAISINPPNMDHVLNSDDSIIIPELTPRRQPRRLSHSFVTSSRILQTLANITQGRTKTASPLSKATGNVDSRMENVQGQSKRRSDNVIGFENEANASRIRKRKASDMLDLSGNPGCFKIPYATEVPRKRINSDFDADGSLKSSRERSTMETTNEPIPGGSKDPDVTDVQTDDLDDTGATDVPENVKCFVYREEADSKERSFLIQAEDSSKNSEAGEIRSGTVRECGPYLLGNVEIRMSEANGTINIWGKEISQTESIDVNAEPEKEESDVDEDSTPSRRPSREDQITPSPKFANGCGSFACSTNKKSKLSPQYVRSSIGKYFRPALSNLKRVNDLARENEAGQQYSSAPILNDRTTGCDNCDSQKLRQSQWTSCDCSMNSRRKRHSCCHQETLANDRDCECSRDHANLDTDVILETVTNILSGHNKCVAAGLHSIKRCCGNHANKETCVNRTSHNRRSPEHHHGDCNRPKKRCSSCADDLPSCNARLTPGNNGCCDDRSRSHSHGSSCDDDDRPLLQNGHCETPETKRRRLSGKKVRGILTDLLRGCGGCRDQSNASFVAKESTSLPNIHPTVRVTPCTPPHPDCAKSSSNCASHSKHPSSRDPTNEKCCSSCSRRTEMAAEIESKLDFLTAEMERLRSRSDTFRGMLNLLNADTD